MSLSFEDATRLTYEIRQQVYPELMEACKRATVSQDDADVLFPLVALDLYSCIEAQVLYRQKNWLKRILAEWKLMWCVHKDIHQYLPLMKVLENAELKKEG